jgi:hypothetical protein
MSRQGKLRRFPGERPVDQAPFACAPKYAKIDKGLGWGPKESDGRQECN